MVNFERELLEIDSKYPLISPRHVLEDSLSFPTVCGMPMENFFTKNPVIGKVCQINRNIFHFGCCNIFDYVELQNIKEFCYFSKWKNIIQTELRKTFVEPASQTREKRAQCFAFCSSKKKPSFLGFKGERRKKHRT